MNLIELKKEQQENYIKAQKLETSYIDAKILWQVRPLMPERIFVGQDENNNTIFFEETGGSLQKRHYGKSSKATSYNLLYCDGNKSFLVKKDYLKTAKIDFNNDYDLDILLNFLKNNNNRFNGLQEKRKTYNLNLTPKEHEMVKEFIKKIREME